MIVIMALRRSKTTLRKLGRKRCNRSRGEVRWEIEEEVGMEENNEESEETGE